MTTRSHYKSSPPADVSKLKVAVLAGGISREREVSIQSGKCVADALKKAGVSVVVSDIKPDSLDILADEAIDVFFIVLHGTFGEDGALQEILESKGLIFTGSASKASKLAFDKWQSKDLFLSAGVPTPEAVLFEPNAKAADLENRIGRLGPKYVIKPLREGSTIGISIADNPAQAVADAKKCAAEFGDCFIEKFVAGRELTVGVLGNTALPIIEIRPKAGIYDYHAKYIDDGTQYLFDTLENPAVVAKIQKYAVDCFNAIGCRGAARVDFILSAPAAGLAAFEPRGETSPLGGDDSGPPRSPRFAVEAGPTSGRVEAGTPYVLEINTIPGMTKHSLLPKAAAYAGLSMSRLCLRIIEMAIADSPARKAGFVRPVRRSPDVVYRDSVTRGGRL